MYACAGHPPPLVLGADEHRLYRSRVCSAPPIGVGMPTGTRQSVVSVPGGAQICFFTDGVTEARVGSQLFGTERLERSLAQLGPDGDGGRAARARRACRPTSAPMTWLLVCSHRGRLRPDCEDPRGSRARSPDGGERAAEQFLLTCGVEPRRGRRAGALRSGGRWIRGQGPRWRCAPPRGTPAVALRREHLHTAARRGARSAGTRQQWGQAHERHSAHSPPTPRWSSGSHPRRCRSRRTPEAEAERWLRLLRLHGEVGATLQALGISEDARRRGDGRHDSRTKS